MKVQFEVNGEKITINASMKVLNEIVAMSDCKSKYCKEKGYDVLSKKYDDWGKNIYNALDAKGFYDDVK